MKKISEETIIGLIETGIRLGSYLSVVAVGYKITTAIKDKERSKDNEIFELKYENLDLKDRMAHDKWLSKFEK